VSTSGDKSISEKSEDTKGELQKRVHSTRSRKW